MSPYTILLAILILFLGACNSNPEIPKGRMTQEKLSRLQWMNSPDSSNLVDGAFLIYANKGTDFFNNPEDTSVAASAPFLFENRSGDFVATAHVQPDFSSQWNAMALMVHIDSLHWIKFAFENSDATGPGVVTVSTNGTSDDANGVVLNDEKQLWLAIVKKKNLYSLHWSKDGKTYHMARLTSMPGSDTVKVGVEAQSPLGESATHRLLHFEVEARTVENLRKLEGK